MESKNRECTKITMLATGIQLNGNPSTKWENQSQITHLKQTQKISCCSFQRAKHGHNTINVMCICSQKLKSTTAAFSNTVTLEHLCKSST